MDLINFVNDFSSEFIETPKTIFNGETNYKELPEWDSVLALSIIGYQLRLFQYFMEIFIIWLCLGNRIY